jgi:hypothetical protein
VARSEAGLRLIIEGENRSRAAMGDFARDMRDSQRTVQAVATTVLSELNPAFASMTSHMGAVARAALNMGSTLGALTIAAGAAGLIASSLIDTWRKNRDELETFDRAVRSFSLERISAEGRKAKNELEGLRLALEAIETKQAVQKALPPATGFQPKGFQDTLRQAERYPNVTRQNELEFRREVEAGTRDEADRAAADVRRQLAENAALLADRANQARAEFAVRELATKEKLLNVDAARAQIQTDLPTFVSAQAALVVLYGQQAKALEDQLRIEEAREVATLRAAYAPESAITAAREEFKLRRRSVQSTTAAQQAAARLAGQRGADALSDELNPSTAAERLTQAEIVAQNQVPAAQELAQRGLNEVRIRGFQNAAEGARIDERALGLSEQQLLARRLEVIEREKLAKLADQDRDRSKDQNIVEDALLQKDVARAESAQRIKSLDSERLAILAQMPGISEAERVIIQAHAIEAEKIARLAEVGLSTEKQRNVELEAAVRLEALRRQERERTDAGAGIAKAALQISDDWAAAGRRAEETFRGVAGVVQQTLASALRGDDIGKNFGKNFLRSIQNVFAEEISRSIVGSLVGGLRSILPGGGASPLGISAPVDVTGAPVSVLAALQQQGNQLVGGAGGRTWAVPSGGGYGGGGMIGPGYSTPTTSGAFEGGAGVGGVGLSDFGTSYGGAGTSYVAGGLGALGAGVATYGILSGASSGEGGPGAGVSALVGGALVGAQVYSSAVAFGATAGLAGGAAAAGVVGGFVVFAAAAILNHYQEMEADDREAKLRRRMARKQQAQDIINQIAGSLNNESLSLSQRLDTKILSRSMRPTGRIVMGPRGPRSESVMREVPTASTGGLLLALAEHRGNSALADLLRRRGYTAENIDIEHDLGIRNREGWVNDIQELAASIDDVDGYLADTLKVLMALEEREALERATPFGYVEQGHGVTRTSYFVTGAIDRIQPGTRDLFYNREIWRETGLTDAEIDRQIRILNNYTIKTNSPTPVSRRRFLEAF